MAGVGRSGIEGRLAWLGVVRDRRVTLASEPLDAVEARFEGIDGECHGGLTRPSCSRVIDQHSERGTGIRNTRQVHVPQQRLYPPLAAAAAAAA